MSFFQFEEFTSLRIYHGPMYHHQQEIQDVFHTFLLLMITYKMLCNKHILLFRVRYVFQELSYLLVQLQSTTTKNEFISYYNQSFVINYKFITSSFPMECLLGLVVLKFNIKWKHGFSLQIEINAEMSFFRNRSEKYTFNAQKMYFEEGVLFVLSIKEKYNIFQLQVLLVNREALFFLLLYIYYKDQRLLQRDFLEFDALIAYRFSFNE